MGRQDDHELTYTPEYASQFDCCLLMYLRVGRVFHINHQTIQSGDDVKVTDRKVILLNCHGSFLLKTKEREKKNEKKHFY